MTAFNKTFDVVQVPSEFLGIASDGACSMLDVARMMISILRLDSDRLRISGHYRPGDVRFAVADVFAAKRIFGWAPDLSLTDGVNELLEWERNFK